MKSPPKILRPGTSSIAIKEKETSDIPSSGKGPRILKPKGRSEVSSPVSDMLTRLEKEDTRRIVRGIERIFDRLKESRPSFSSSWISHSTPEESNLITQYDVEGTNVKIFHLPEETESLYYVTPSEYEFPIEIMRLLDMARVELSKHVPETVDLQKPEEARSYVERYGRTLLEMLARREGIKVAKTRREEIRALKRLSSVLAKYTAGYGIFEVFMLDKRIRDIYVDAPPSLSVAHLNVSKVGISDPRMRETCKTNVRLGDDDAESLLSRFRYESGRPFSEARPVLEHNIAAYDTRVTLIGNPLSPQGIGLALRRHSTDPWTLLRFIENETITALTAGLLSFLIDGNSTILVAGSRGAGKTSLLGALMLEFPQSQRIIVIEDTLELPVLAMKRLGYKVQSLHVQAPVGAQETMSPGEALQVSLRLGESVLVLGEVRGKEAKTLYEAMRAGTAGSSVLGTFHADSAMAVFERVTEDMGISARSFNATDIVVICGLTKPGGAEEPVRKVTQIAEVVKMADTPGTFRDLMIYDERERTLAETDSFRFGSERLGKIAGLFGITLEDALKDIQTRAKYRQIMVDFAKSSDRPSVLAAEWVAKSNNEFRNLLRKHYRDRKTDYEAVLRDWTEWFERHAVYA